MTHPVINDWQVDKGPFGVTIVRGVVVQRDERGNTIAGPETHQLLWESRGMFGITSNGTSTTGKLKIGYPHMDPYPSLREITEWMAP
jgi:hypothetical protein